MRSAPQLCDVSFGCEPVIEKSKKRPLSTTASAAPSIRLTSSDSVRPELGLPPLPSSLSVHNSLLPEIQPTYKPIRTPDFGADTSPRKKKGKSNTKMIKIKMMRVIIIIILKTMQLMQLFNINSLI